MRAELLKLRSMPTPRWTLAILLAFFVGGIVASVIWGVGTDSAVLDLAVGLPGQIAALVVGSWMAGVEFGQNTLRRALSADPRRTHESPPPDMPNATLSRCGAERHDLRQKPVPQLA